MRLFATVLALLMLAFPAQAQFYFDGADKPYPKPILTPGGVTAPKGSTSITPA